MKKIIVITVLAAVALALLCLLIGGIAYQKQMEAIDIIGGADGPTAIFVAGDIASILIPFFIIGLLLIIGTAALIHKNANKQR